MFAKTIIDSDAFLDMPASSQLLYFHLCMRADDEGFINKPKSIIRLIGCSDDDLKILFMKNFIIPFESGIVVIKHWKIHNYIRSDRMHYTEYQDEKNQLYTKKNGAYTLCADTCQSNDNLLTDACQSSDSETQTEVRLGKVSKDINGDLQSPSMNDQEKLEYNFKLIYDIYPRKAGKADAFKHYCAWLKGKKTSFGTKKLTNKQMWHAVKTFVDQQQEKNVSLEFYPYFSTFMNGKILDYLPEDE